MTHARTVKNAVFVAATLVASTAAGSALALGPVDDRMIPNRIVWAADGSKALTDFAPTFFGANGNEFRVTDVHVESLSPMVLSTVAVQNTGAYQIQGAIGWFHGESVDTVRAMKNDGRRVVVMRAYFNGTDVHLIGVTVPMSQANGTARDWKIISGTEPDQIQAPSGYRPAIATAAVNGAGIRQTFLLVVENAENISCHVNWTNNDNNIESTGFNASLLDAEYYDDGVMHSATIFCNQSDDPEGKAFFDADGLQNLFDAATDPAKPRRPLFLTKETLHGTGTANGDTQWLTSFVAD